MIAHGGDPMHDEGLLHRRLAHFNAGRLRASGPEEWPPERIAVQRRLIDLQNDFVERERAQVRDEASTAPADAESFLGWFTALRANGPGQHDPLFPWLAESAPLADMRWFIAQEAAGEAGFDDLVALTQVKLPTRAKLEMARNYWDEMGRGQEAGMHGALLERLVRFLGLRVSIERTVWPSLALGNLMVALASERQYAFHSVGALGVIELTAPDRVAQVARGLHRLGIPTAQCIYFDLHAVLDLKHGAAWGREVIAPLVERDPRAARWIAEGALMRLRAGARCYEDYRACLSCAQATGAAGA